MMMMTCTGSENWDVKENEKKILKKELCFQVPNKSNGRRAKKQIRSNLQRKDNILSNKIKERFIVHKNTERM